MNWVKGIFNTLTCFVWVLVLAGYAVPNFEHSTAHKVGMAIFAIFASGYTNTSVHSGFLCIWLHFFFFVYGPAGTKSSQPTFAKYVTVPIYIITVLQLVDIAFLEKEFYVPLAAINLGYTVLVWVGLLPLDKPIEESKRLVEDNGKEVKYEITNDGYYLVYFYMFVRIAALGLGLVLLFSHSGTPTEQSVVLQVMSMLLLIVAQHFAIRETDRDQFSALIF